MPLLTGRDEIRARLNADRLWSVYALTDLSAVEFPNTRWFTPDLALVYQNYGTSVLFAMGPASVAEALRHVTWPVHLQLRAAAMERVAELAVVTRRIDMWRCGWMGNAAGWVDTRGTCRLTLADVPALQRLYADGEAAAEGPDFFFPSMVERGVFFGIYDKADLVAVAGTHVYEPAEGAAAIGNVYTRRDRRALGLGKQVTCAVLRELSPLQTVGLNVRSDNLPAIRVYEQLGFERHCRFFEAIATGFR